jgi:hypothetical protein
MIILFRLSSGDSSRPFSNLCHPSWCPTAVKVCQCVNYVGDECVAEVCVIVNRSNNNNDIIIPYFEWESSKKCNSERFCNGMLELVGLLLGFWMLSFVLYFERNTALQKLNVSILRCKGGRHLLKFPVGSVRKSWAQSLDQLVQLCLIFECPCLILYTCT